MLGAAQQQTVDLEVAGLKVGSGFDEKKEPRAAATVEGGGVVAGPVAQPCLTEAVDPNAKGLLVLVGEGLDGDNVEAGRFGDGNFGRKRLEGEAGVEGAQSGCAGGSGAGHAMQEQQAAGDQQILHGGEVVAETGGLDLFEDADVGDFVEAFGAIGGGAEVAVLDGAAPLESAEANALGGNFSLAFAGGDALDVGLARLGRIQQEAAPSTGDIEEAIASIEGEEGANAFEGIALGTEKVFIRLAKMSAGVSEEGTQP